MKSILFCELVRSVFSAVVFYLCFSMNREQIEALLENSDLGDEAPNDTESDDEEDQISEVECLYDPILSDETDEEDNSVLQHNVSGAFPSKDGKYIWLQAKLAGGLQKMLLPPQIVLVWKPKPQ